MRAASSPLLLAVVAALAFVPNLQNATGFSTFYLVYAYFVFFWIAQSTSWNILSGYTGYFSFGQGAFYGLGVYTAGDLVTREGVNYFLTIPIAGVLGGALAAAVGALAFRLGSLRGRDLRAADAGRDVHARVDRRAQHLGRRRPGHRDSDPGLPGLPRRLPGPRLPARAGRRRGSPSSPRS